MKCKNVFRVMAVIMLLMIGCNKDNPSTKSDGHNNSIENLQKEYIGSLAARDSMIKGLAQKVDTLTRTLNEVNVKMAKMQSDESSSTPSMVWRVLPLLLGILALIGVFVVGWLIRHDVEENDVEDIVDRHLWENGLRNLKDRVQTLENSRTHQSPVGNSSNNNVVFLEERISDLERQMSNLQQPQKPVNQISPTVAQNVQPSATKRLYAKSTNGKFFMEITETKQETCAFVIELISDTKGVFDIESFHLIAQMNGLDSFVIYTGDCRMEEATSYKTSHKGECEKQANDYWKVTKELEITISK